MADSATLVAESMAAAGLPTTGDMPDTSGSNGGDAGAVETLTPDDAGDAGDGGGSAEEKTIAAQTGIDKPDTPPKTVEKPVEKAAVPDDLDKILTQYGITPPKQGKGSYTYDRFRKVLASEVKKIADKFEGDVKPLKDRTGQIDAVERLIASDPTRYLTMLSAVHPQYKKYLEPPTPSAPKVEPPAFDLTKDPMPQPDAKFPDGSLGYSPEGFQKYQDWNNRKLAAEIRADLQKQFEAKFGQLEGRLSPYERQAQIAAIREAEMPKVQATIAKLTERWGDIFVNDVGDTSKPNPNSLLMKHMRENPGMTVYEAALDVYLPLKDKHYQERLDKQRDDIHKELNGRPGAADRTAGPGERVERSKGNMSLTDIVREQMAGKGLV